MSSLIWLLLYLAPLLGLTAALFAWLGWQWRSSDLLKRIDELTAQINTVNEALREAETARAAALEKAATTTAAPAIQDTAAADEIKALKVDLKAAQSESRLRQEEAAKAHETALALKTEMARLLAEVDQLRAAHSSAQTEIESLRSAPAAAAESEPPPAKPKRKRSTTAKAKAPASTLREKITALESQLQSQQAGLATLTEERDDMQRRLSQFEEPGQAQADPSSLNLSRRGLADSEKRLVAATSEIEQLQNQMRVLLQVEETNAAHADVPDDDLTQIKGIKKIISEQLRAHGIRTWRQIALWNADELRAFSELLAFKNRATREQWQEQARALHEAAHGPLP